jgi:hypothetical protein
MGRYVLVFILGAFALAFVASEPVKKWSAKTFPIVQPDLDTIYYIRQGAVYCGNSSYSSCGMHLWNCTNEIEYVCMHDVGIKKKVQNAQPVEP